MGDVDLARLGAFGERNRHGEHAVLVGRRDRRRVNAFAERQLSAVGAEEPLVGQPLHGVLGTGGAVRRDGQGAVVDVDIHRPGVDTGQVGGQHVVVIDLAQVHRHEPRGPSSIRSGWSASPRVKASRSLNGSKRSTAIHLLCHSEPATLAGDQSLCTGEISTLMPRVPDFRQILPVRTELCIGESLIRAPGPARRATARALVARQDRLERRPHAVWVRITAGPSGAGYHRCAHCSAVTSTGNNARPFSVSRYRLSDDDEHPVGGEDRQPVGDRTGRRAELGLEVGEPADPDERRDQQREPPAVADHAHRLREQHRRP